MSLPKVEQGIVKMKAGLSGMVRMLVPSTRAPLGSGCKSWDPRDHVSQQSKNLRLKAEATVMGGAVGVNIFI